MAVGKREKEGEDEEGILFAVSGGVVRIGIGAGSWLSLVWGWKE